MTIATVWDFIGRKVLDARYGNTGVVKHVLRNELLLLDTGKVIVIRDARVLE